MAVTFLVLVAAVVWRLWEIHGLGSIPLGLAGLALLWLRDFSEPQEISKSERVNVIPLAVAAWVLFTLGKWLDSSSLQLLALGILALAWLVGVVGWARAGGLILLIGLICLPQGLIHEKVLLHLQRLATAMASWALDVARVPHVPQGAVLETVRGDLFVEEACSGMQSLLTGLIVAQIYFAWHRAGVFFSLAGLAGTGLLLLLGNGLRIFIIALLYVRYDIDWTAGWRHEMTGTVVYLAVLSLLPSLRQLLQRTLAAREHFFLTYGQWHHAGISDDEKGMLKPLEAWRVATSLIPVSVCWAVLGMATAGAVEFVMFQAFAASDKPVTSANLPKLAGLEFPNELAGWRQDRAGKQVSFIEQFALDQHVWCFRKGPLTAWVAADLPFDELHPLRACYLNRNWYIVKEDVCSRPPVSPFAFMELRSKETTRPPMLVLFDNFNLSKKHYVGGVPPTRLEGRWQMMSTRLKRTQPAAGPFCQVQVVVAGTDTLESDTGQQAAQLLAAARIALAARLSNP